MSAANLTYRQTGLRYSGIIHGVLLLIAILGLPHWFHHTDVPEPMVMSVEILPIAPMSNVKPQEEAPKPVEKEQKAESRKPVPETSKAQAKPKPAETIPAPIPKPEKKVEKEKPQEKKMDDDLEKILKSVQDTAKTQESKKPQVAKAAAATPAKSERYDATMPLSMSEMDAIRGQFAKCWNVPAGAKDAQNLIIVLRIALLQDGSVTDVALARDEARYNSDSFFRAASDSAIRAVRLCSPLKNLPADKFGTWRDMELTFDPRDALN